MRSGRTRCRIVIPDRRPVRRAGRRRTAAVDRRFGGRRSAGRGPRNGGIPVRPRPERTRLPGHRDPVKEDLRGIGAGQRGPHLVLLARDRIGYRSLCRLVSRANLAGTKGMPRFSQALLAEHVEGLVALSGCRDGEIARRLRVGDREGARTVAEGYARLFGSRSRRLVGRRTTAAEAGPARVVGAQRGSRRPASSSSSSTTSCPTTTGWWPRPPGWPRSSACRSSSPTTSITPRPRAASSRTSSRRSATGDRSGRWPTSADPMASPTSSRPPSCWPCRRAMARPPATIRGPPGPGPRGWPTPASWPRPATVDLGFEAYRFPGFAVPGGETPFSYLAELCHEGARQALPPDDPGRRPPARPRARDHRADRPGRVLPHLLGPDALRRSPEGSRPRVAGARPTRSSPMSWGSPGSTRSATTSCSSGSSTRAGRPTRTSTSTSRRSGARRSSSTSTSATGPSTPGWSATSSRTGPAPSCARSAWRSGSRGRWSTGSRRRSRPTTR